MLACIHGASKHGRYLSLATTSTSSFVLGAAMCAIRPRPPPLVLHEHVLPAALYVTLCCCADMHLLIPLLYPCYCVMPLALPAVRARSTLGLAQTCTISF